MLRYDRGLAVPCLPISALAMFAVLLAASASCLAQVDSAKEEADSAEPAPMLKAMDNDQLGNLLEQRFDNIEGHAGFWIIRVGEEKPARPEDEAPEEEALDERVPFDDTDELKEADEAKAEDVVLMVITDERADRMRIMTPIQEFDPEDDDDAELAVILLRANFDRALDAKYALNNGILWSCFVHPLSTLSESDLDNALGQVQTLKKNTGTSYSSTDLIFGGGALPEPEDEPEGPAL